MRGHYSYNDAKMHLHSTMFLLIQVVRAEGILRKNNLHSTMFLLILGTVSIICYRNCDLHSTMFLLIPIEIQYNIDCDNSIYIPQCFY